MPEIINAGYENGVFKPLEKIQVKEHQKVTLKIISHDEWEKRFNRIIKKIHRKTAPYPPEEIEADISKAIQEVRKEKMAVRAVVVTHLLTTSCGPTPIAFDQLKPSTIVF